MADVGATDDSRVDAEAGYPQHWEADILLRQGGTAHIRPIRVTDADLIVELHSRLSERSIYFRFFAPYPELTPRDVHYFTHVDHDTNAALVATLGGHIVGVVRWSRARRGDPEAEVAFTVRDDLQGQGLGSILLEHLASAARERGIRRFVADVLPDNRAMLGVFRDAGYGSTSQIADGVVRLELAIEPTSESRAVTAAREHRAEARSIERLLTPRTVAVVGVGRDPGSVGAMVLRHLLDAGFTGQAYAVNEHAEGSLLGVPTYGHVSDVPQEVDVAVVATPASGMRAVVTDAAGRSVHALVVVSGGFAEVGEDGRELQRDLVGAAHANGMRVVGPNCYGVINTDPLVRLNASLSPTMPRRGRVGFFSQSGVLGTALLETLVGRGLGVSTFVSAGNRADVSGNDLLQYWEEDAATDVVLLYLESIGNPRKFSRIAGRLSRHKPIVAVKSGRSSQGIPLGHRVRPSTLPPGAVDAMFQQAGVIQVDTLAEMFDVAMLLTFQPLPAGGRVSVVGNSDALVVLAVDAGATQGLEIVGVGRTVAPGTTAAEFGAELSRALDDPQVDAVVILFAPPVGETGEAYVRQIATLCDQATKPVVATVLAVEGVSDLLREVNPDGLPILGSVPTFATVEAAVRALAAVTRYARWKARPVGVLPDLEGVDRDGARAIVARALAAGRGSGALEGADLLELLACYGINMWPVVPVRTLEEALAAAEGLGYPVVLKSSAPTLMHRADLGGVRLDLGDELALTQAVEAMSATLGRAATETLLVQRMAGHGVPCLVGTAEDALFGPIVWFGVGGVVTELVEDRAYAIPPLSDRDAYDLVRAPRAAPLLLGHRGAPVVDTEELQDLVVRVSQLSDDIPELVALELNPVLASPDGARVLGAAARLEPATLRTDRAERRLPTG